MKKIYVLMICCTFLLCGCKSTREYNILKNECATLSNEIDEYKEEIESLKDKNKELKSENSSIKKELKSYKNNIKNDASEETTTKTVTTTVKKDEVKIIYPELPLEVSYINSSGIEVTCRIDKISCTYDGKFSDGTCTLRFYFTGEKIYDKNGSESIKSGMLYAALYDENNNIAHKNGVTLSKVKTGEKFYDCDRIFLDVELGKVYTLKIYNRD